MGHSLFGPWASSQLTAVCLPTCSSRARGLMFCCRRRLNPLAGRSDANFDDGNPLAGRCGRRPSALAVALQNPALGRNPLEGRFDHLIPLMSSMVSGEVYTGYTLVWIKWVHFMVQAIDTRRMFALVGPYLRDRRRDARAIAGRRPDDNWQRMVKRMLLVARMQYFWSTCGEVCKRFTWLPSLRRRALARCR